MAGIRLPLESYPLQALVSEPVKPVFPCVVMSNADPRLHQPVGQGRARHRRGHRRLHLVHASAARCTSTCTRSRRSASCSRASGACGCCATGAASSTSRPTARRSSARRRCRACSSTAAGAPAASRRRRARRMSSPGRWRRASRIPIAAPFSLERFRDGRLIDEAAAAGGRALNAADPLPVLRRAPGDRVPYGGQAHLARAARPGASSTTTNGPRTSTCATTRAACTPSAGATCAAAAASSTRCATRPPTGSPAPTRLGRERRRERASAPRTAGASTGRGRSASRFDGAALQGLAGDTLASALLANGVHLVGRSFKYHRPRGMLDGRRRGAERARDRAPRRGARDAEPARDPGRALRRARCAHSQNRWPSLAFDVGARRPTSSSPLFPAGFYYKTFMWPRSAWATLYEPLIRRAAGLGRAPAQPDPDRYAQRYAHCDVLVVGAGPAGLAAALAAADARRARDPLRRAGGARRLAARRLRGAASTARRPTTGSRWSARRARRQPARARCCRARRPSATSRTTTSASSERLTDHLAEPAGRRRARAPVAGARARGRARDRRHRAAARVSRQRPAGRDAGRRRAQLPRAATACAPARAPCVVTDDGRRLPRGARSRKRRRRRRGDRRPARPTASGGLRPRPRSDARHRGPARAPPCAARAAGWRVSGIDDRRTTHRLRPRADVAAAARPRCISSRSRAAGSPGATRRAAFVPSQSRGARALRRARAAACSASPPRLRTARPRAAAARGLRHLARNDASLRGQRRRAACRMPRRTRRELPARARKPSWISRTT